MKLEIMLQDIERETRQEDLKKSANIMKKLGANDATIFKMLKEDYYDHFSDEEIRKLMNEAK